MNAVWSKRCLLAAMRVAPLCALLYAGSAASAAPVVAPTAPTAPTAPAPAAAVGYLTRTFDGTFTNASVDLGNTGLSGFSWYPFRFFGATGGQPEGVEINADGSVLLGAAGQIASLASAAPASGPTRWVGQAFGGGAYFEAVLKFDPENTAHGKPKDWPAFWSMSIEHLVGLPGEQWPGQPPGYAHFIEPDFFEYDVWSFRPRNYYGGAVHESYGVYQHSCSGENFCSVSNPDFTVATPSGTDFRSFHRFGLLWIPATASTPGYARYYFDGVATSDVITWSQFTNQPPPPDHAPWKFGVVDQQHLVLILGTGAGQPMTVASVAVWQASSAKNLKN